MYMYIYLQYVYTVYIYGICMDNHIYMYIYYTRVLLVLLELFPQVKFQINRVVFV